MKRPGASPPEPWHALLAPLPAGVVPRRSLVAPPEVAAKPEGAAIGGWENLVVELSADPAGLRVISVVLDGTGRPIAASDHVMYRSVGAAEASAVVEYRHESVGGRLEADGTFHGTRWRNVSVEEAGGTVRAVEAVSSEPSAAEVSGIHALVEEIMRRSPASAGDRLPPIPEERMTEPQRRAAAELAAGPRGSVAGPFVPLLRSPGLLSPLQKVGEYLRWESPLPARLRELAILMTARWWTQQYEWHTHRLIAAEVGLDAGLVAAIAEGRRPERMAEDEEAVHAFCEELYRTRGIGDATWARVVARLGEQGTVDLLGICGYYTALAMVMNAARTPLPEGVPPSLAPLED